MWNAKFLQIRVEDFDGLCIDRTIHFIHPAIQNRRFISACNVCSAIIGFGVQKFNASTGSSEFRVEQADGKRPLFLQTHESKAFPQALQCHRDIGLCGGKLFAHQLLCFPIAKVSLKFLHGHEAFRRAILGARRDKRVCPKDVGVIIPSRQQTLLWLPEQCHELSLVDLVGFFIQKLMSFIWVSVAMQTCLITPHRAHWPRSIFEAFAKHFIVHTQVLWPSRTISGHVHQGVQETGAALGDVQPEHGRSLHSAHFSRFDLQMPQQMHLNLQGIHRQGQKDETDETSTYGSHMGSAAVSFLRRLAHFRPKRVDRRTLEPLPKNVPKWCAFPTEGTGKRSQEVGDFLVQSSSIQISSDSHCNTATPTKTCRTLNPPSAVGEFLPSTPPLTSRLASEQNRPGINWSI